MFCFKCGTQVPDDAIYCTKCGTKLISDMATTSNPAAVIASAPNANSNPAQQAPVLEASVAAPGESLAEKGKALKKEGYYEEAVRCFQKGAEQGDADCMFWLGNAYEVGEGVQGDMHDVVYWYEKACDLGQIAAMNNLAIIYENGAGPIQKDVQRAIQLFEKAVLLGSTTSMVNLACLFLGSGGDISDWKRGLELYEKAIAKDKNVVTAAGLASQYKNNTSIPMVFRDFERSFELFKYCADNVPCVIDAYWQLAHMYAYGLGTMRDIDKAKECMKMLPEGYYNLNEEVVLRINENQSNEEFGAYSLNEAYTFIEQGKGSHALLASMNAANCGYREAGLMLYLIYRQGIIEEDGISYKNPQKAAYWLEYSFGDGSNVLGGVLLALAREKIIGEIMPVNLDEAANYLSPLSDDTVVPLGRRYASNYSARDVRDLLAQAGHPVNPYKPNNSAGAAGISSKDIEFESFI